MSETPPSPNPPKQPEPSYLSFANPNYCLDGQGQANDLQSPVGDDDPLSFGRLSVDEGTTPDRRAYANSDYSSGDVTPSSPDRSFILQKLKSPSDEEADTDDDTSSLEDDSEMTHNLLGSQEDMREESSYQPISEATAGGKKSRGILGYLAMLEQQAKGGVVDKKRPEGSTVDGFETPDDLDGGLIEEGDALLPTHKLQIATDINSPDSHDSGIQSDIRSEKTVKHVRGPLTDDIYAVVDKKPAKKEGKKPDIVENGHEEISQEVEPQEKKEDNDGNQDAPTDVLPPGWEKHEGK
ncbi:hypothetical protein ACOMHN_033346 [Nucella lapillus]